MLYCVIVYACTFTTLQIALKLCQYIGTKKVLTLGIVLMAAFYYMLHSLVISKTFTTIAVVDGSSLGLYFGAYNMLLTKAMKRSHEGHGYALQLVIGMLAGVLGPLIGSLIIKQLSFQNLFLVVIVILAITPIPLFFSKEYKPSHESLKLSAVLTGSPARKRIDRAVFLQGILYGSGTIWPLFLYIHYPHIVALGILASISAALVLIGTYVIGNSVDKHQGSAYGLGSLFFAPTWLTRLLYVTPIGLAINAFSASLFAIAPTMAVSKDIFHTAKLSKSRSAHFSRVEFYMDAGRVTIFGIAFFTGNLTAMFVVSAFATLCFLGCRPKVYSRKVIKSFANI
jgi:MFS family permease